MSPSTPLMPSPTVNNPLGLFVTGTGLVAVLNVYRHTAGADSAFAKASTPVRSNSWAVTTKLLVASEPVTYRP